MSTVYPTADVLVYDIPRAGFTRLTFDGNNVRSVWTPNGNRVTFSSDRAGGLPNIYWVASDGSGSPERLTTSDFERSPEDWAPDGKTLVFGEMRPETNWDIWTLPFPDRTPQLFMRTRFFEGARSVSPDGRWLWFLFRRIRTRRGVCPPVSRRRRKMADLHRWWGGVGMVAEWPSSCFTAADGS